MENENKLNIDDYALVTDRKGDFPYGFDICKIDKISKDGTKARGRSNTLQGNMMGRGEIFEFPIELQDYRQFLIDYMDKQDIEYPVLVVREKDSDFALFDGQPTEDDYDDVIHFSFFNIKCKYEASHINDIPNGAFLGTWGDGRVGGHIRAYFCKSVHDMADYIIARFNLRTKSTLQERFKKWLAAYGNDNDKIDVWKDYWGGYKQLEWAIDNGEGPMAYGEWQTVQRVLKHELRFSTAKMIGDILYEKENICISDCE